MPVSLDGLVLAPVADQAPGQVGTRTRFTYHERGGEIWAEYTGGDVVRGHLVGTREGDRIDFRYVQLKHDGATSSGHCVATVVELADGRVRLEELGVGVAGGQRHQRCGAGHGARRLTDNSSAA